jgi:hypothetical protein
MRGMGLKGVGAALAMMLVTQQACVTKSKHEALQTDDDQC